MIEKVIFKDPNGINLSGIIYMPKIKTESAVIISHGFCSNKDRLRLVNLAKALFDAGFGVLRFDFGGCGESEDREITVTNQVEDLKAAIKLMQSKGYSNLGLFGESLGGLTSLLAYDNEIKTLVLWAPVTKSKKQELILKEELHNDINEKGFTTFYKDSREFRIPRQYVEEREAVNQKEMLSRIKCPVLIIHGDKDNTIPWTQSKEAMEYLPKESKLEVIEGGCHKLDSKTNLAIPMTVNWFKEYLTKD